MTHHNRDQFEIPSEADLERVRAVLAHIGGGNVVWGAGSSLEVLLVERRMAAERHASERLTRATVVLAMATVVLALATVALVLVTLHE